MQTLTDYLKGRRKADFAKQIGVRPDQLSQYLSGYRRPSYDQMVLIERETDGLVPVGVWAHPPANVDSSAQLQPPARKRGAA